ncbi:MAG: hypothetical protein AAFY76_09155 [Cyanobacteria bacterium J06649_11]
MQKHPVQEAQQQLQPIEIVMSRLFADDNPKNLWCAGTIKEDPPQQVLSHFGDALENTLKVLLSQATEDTLETVLEYVLTQERIHHLYDNTIILANQSDTGEAAFSTVLCQILQQEYTQE